MFLLKLHFLSSQCCLADRLGISIGVHNWRFSSCSWHISKSGAAFSLLTSALVDFAHYRY